MSSTEYLRQPPRFVPTLTDVVAEHKVQQTQSHETVELVQIPTVAVVDSKSLEQTEEVQQGSHSASVENCSAQTYQLQIADNLRLKIVQRLEADLDAQLSLAVTECVELHAKAIHEALRSQIDALVKKSIDDVIAQETARLQLGRSE